MAGGTAKRDQIFYKGKVYTSHAHIWRVYHDKDPENVAPLNSFAKKIGQGYSITKALQKTLLKKEDIQKANEEALKIRLNGCQEFQEMSKDDYLDQLYGD